MEKHSPVRKPHTSSADLLTCSETTAVDLPDTVPCAARSRQPFDEIRKVVFGGEVIDEEVESLNRRKPISGYMLKKINGSGIFAAGGKYNVEELDAVIFNPTNKTGLRMHQVILHQWWLVNLPHQSKLAVGGFVNRQTLGRRVLGSPASSSASAKRGNLKPLENLTQEFKSAPIVKKLKNNTLEAEDGSKIIIIGCINTSRTLSYGFSHEVCDRFRTGFPCTWEEYAAKTTYEKCTNTTEKSFPETFDDLPVTQVRDLIMSTTGESESRVISSIIFRDIMKHSSEVSLKISKKNQMKRTGSQTRYPLRSMKKNS